MAASFILAAGSSPEPSFSPPLEGRGFFYLLLEIAQVNYRQGATSRPGGTNISAFSLASLWWPA